MNILRRVVAPVLLLVALSGSFAVGVWYGYSGVGHWSSLVSAAPCTEGSCVLNRLAQLTASVLNSKGTPPGNIDFSSFWKVWQLIDTRYVNGNATTSTGSLGRGAVSDEERLYGAIKGMVATLNDPYTVFMPPKESTSFKQDIQGNFGGVGMEVGFRDNLPTVIAPLPNSPAKAAGILAGDQIIKVNGEVVTEMPLDEVVGKIRGRVGTAVVITIARGKDKALKDVRLVRAVITIPTIDTKIVNGANSKDKIQVITLYNFSQPAAGLFKTEINKFAQSGNRKLILDLRGNPGGYLDAAVDIASWFLPEGKVIVREVHKAGTAERAYRSLGYNLFRDRPLEMVVLVDRGSASASEILAGALAEYGVATLIGEKTFGKGSVQELIAITPSTSLKLTIAKWLTPNGRSISQGGLTPAIIVTTDTGSASAAADSSKLDPVLERAIKYLSTGR